MALALSGCTKHISENDVDKTKVPPSVVADWIARSPEKYLLVDVRPLQAFQAGHIPGARNMELPQVDAQKIDPDLNRFSGLIVYDEDPAFGRANAMVKRLLEAGLNAYLLEGGFRAWKSGGRPVTAPKP